MVSDKSKYISCISSKIIPIKYDITVRKHAHNNSTKTTQPANIHHTNNNMYTLYTGDTDNLVSVYMYLRENKLSKIHFLLIRSLLFEHKVYQDIHQLHVYFENSVSVYC